MPVCLSWKLPENVMSQEPLYTREYRNSLIWALSKALNSLWITLKLATKHVLIWDYS